MPRPTSVQGLAKSLNIPLIDLLLACKFCLTFLTNIEKLKFDDANLRLLWRGRRVYGCCQCCLRLCSKIEQTLFPQTFLSAQAFHYLETHTSKVPARCGSCYSPLTREEYFSSGITRKLRVVRGTLRGDCNLCKSAILE
ncbi:E6 [Enhydra lutris papillomavirus 1]|uniref:Protein E6 n=1 Tax=Enhydra lutris papillomavirus 1 TaxID=1472717 RepID=W8R5Y7_9PAPI|nr:E6 [Enhydra lutris papillomavirus 1]AHL83542.1 E6 [Enhydra lutris papillomavirus 1]